MGSGFILLWVWSKGGSLEHGSETSGSESAGNLTTWATVSFSRHSPSWARVTSSLWLLIGRTDYRGERSTCW